MNFSTTMIFIGLFVPFAIPLYPDHPKGLIGSIDVFNAMNSFELSAPFTNVTAITVERYFAISRREFHKEHCTPVKMGFIVLFIWLYLLKETS